MPIQVAWGNDEKTILKFTYQGNWDLRDFYQATDRSNDLLSEVAHTVALIQDVQGSKMIPNGFMGAIGNINRKIHPNAGMVIMLGINPFARAFIELYRRVYPEKPGEKRVHFAASDHDVRRLMLGM